MYADLIGVTTKDNEIINGEEFWIPRFSDDEYTKDFIPRYITKERKYKEVFRCVNSNIISSSKNQIVTLDKAFSLLSSNYLKRFIDMSLDQEEVLSIDYSEYTIIISCKRLIDIISTIPSSLEFLTWESQRLIFEIEENYLDYDNLYLKLEGNYNYTNQIVALYLIRVNDSNFHLYVQKFLTLNDKFMHDNQYVCNELIELVDNYKDISNLINFTTSNVTRIYNSIYLYNGLKRLEIIKEDKYFGNIDKILFDNLDDSLCIDKHIYTKVYRKNKFKSNEADKSLSSITNNNKSILPRLQENGFYLSMVTCENYNWRMLKSSNEYNSNRFMYYILGLKELYGPDLAYKEIKEISGKMLNEEIDKILKLVLYRDDIEMDYKKLVLEGLFSLDNDNILKSLILSKSFTK